MDIRRESPKNRGLFMVRPALLPLFSLLLCSCASVSVSKVEVLKSQPPAKAPEKILVRPFEFYDPNVRVDRSGESLAWAKNDIREKFTRHLVRRLKTHVAPAEAVAATAPLPRGNYWLVEGRFDRVYQGSRMLRSVVGFGFGGTKLDTSVVVSDLSGSKPRPFLLIQLTGGSNASPGAIGTAMYFVSGVTALGSATNLVEGLRSGLTFDVMRSSRETAASLTEYLHEQGAFTDKQVLKSKRLGALSYPWWPFNPKAPRKQGSVTVTPVEPTPGSGTTMPAKPPAR